MKGRVKKAVKRVLRKASWELKRASEVNSAVMKGMQNSYYSCWHIENSALVFNARIDQGGDVISMCCEPIADIPKCSFDGMPEEILERFIGMRALAVKRGQRSGFTSGCKKCAVYQKSNWNGGDGQIHYINLSMYPAPCQCRCIYCGTEHGFGGNQGIESEAAQAAYEKLFAVLKLANDMGLIAQDATWQVSSGEITIHPYRERIMALVQGRKAIFFTNCFKYDEAIAQNLHDNPGSAINLSIDAGTAETWQRVKGFNNFDTVVSHLAKYREKSTRSEQITLKYIVLPGINDSMEDYMGLVQIMKKLNIRNLTVSRNTDIKYCFEENDRDGLLHAAARLLAVCQKHKIECDMEYAYTPAERGRIKMLRQTAGLGD